MRTEELIINKMPVPTFRWLKMNECRIKINGAFQSFIPEMEEEATRGEEDFSKVVSGLGEELAGLAKEDGCESISYRIKKDEAKAPMIMHFLYESKENQHSSFQFYLEEGAKLTLFLHRESEEKAEGSAYLQEKFILEKNAELNLILVSKFGDAFQSYDDLSLQLQESAKVKLSAIHLCGKSAHIGYRADLLGNRSEAEMHLGYFLEKQERADYNLLVNHFGKKSESHIYCNGVLRGEAFKIFRGTIDLKHGAKGACGNEQENVLLMDDNVVNQTIPVILCDEDDVEGNHGATIGRLDEDSVFYMQSRGMDLESTYELMAEARMENVIHSISDKSIQAYIEETIRGKGKEEE